MADSTRAVPPAETTVAPTAAPVHAAEPLADVKPALQDPPLAAPATPTRAPKVEDDPFAAPTDRDVKPFASQLGDQHLSGDVKPFGTPPQAGGAVDVKPNVASPSPKLGRGKRARKAVKYDDGDGDGDDDDFVPGGDEDDFESPRKRGKRAPGEKSVCLNLHWLALTFRRRPS